MSLKELPELINAIFDALDVLVVRATLLALIILGAYALLKSHHL